MAKTYLNKINEAEVSLAIEQLLIADYTQVWTPGRIDVDSPPAGFTALGAVVEDTPVMRYGREKFQLQTGIPAVTQFESIQSMEGGFECQLHSNSWRKLQYALGNFTATASATTVATITSVVDSGTFVVTSGASITPHRHYIFAATAAGFDAGDASEAVVTSVTSVSSTVQLVTVSPPPFKSPAANWAIGSYEYVRQVFGGSTIKYYKLLGVADFINGIQVVHQLFKVSPADEVTEEFRPDQNTRIPLNFNALGVETQIGSCTELVIGDRYQFPKNSFC